MSTAGDKVPVICPTCNKRLLVPATSIGKQARCPSCQAVFPLEQVYEAEVVQPLPSQQPANDFGSFAPATSNDMWESAPTQNAPQPMYPTQAGYGQQQPANDTWGGTAVNTGSNPFSDSSTATTSNPYASPQYATASYSPYKPQKKGQFWDSSVLGGLALMAIAVVWFFGGLALNVIFIYPPILFIIGIVVLVKGLASGSVAG